jgi:hypothetical protein
MDADEERNNVINMNKRATVENILCTKNLHLRLYRVHVCGLSAYVPSVPLCVCIDHVQLYLHAALLLVTFLKIQHSSCTNLLFNSTRVIFSDTTFASNTALGSVISYLKPQIV